MVLFPIRLTVTLLGRVSSKGNSKLLLHSITSTLAYVSKKEQTREDSSTSIKVAAVPRQLDMVEEEMVFLYRRVAGGGLPLCMKSHIVWDFTTNKVDQIGTPTSRFSHIIFTQALNITLGSRIAMMSTPKEHPTTIAP